MDRTPLQHFGETALTLIVEKILAKDPAGQAELHRVIAAATRFYFVGRVGPAAEDLVQDVFLATLQGILGRKLRDPRCLISYALTIARRLCSAYISNQARQLSFIDEINVREIVPDRTTNIERDAIKSQERAIAAAVLLNLRPRDRELLFRFYIREQRPEQIISEMGLTETQFRLTKWRAKAEFSRRAAASMPEMQPARRYVPATCQV